MSRPLSVRAASWRELARPGTLVVLDFDGTLARIVPDHRAARLAPATRQALARVASRYPVAILSGRASADVAARLTGIPVRWVIGSHGAEWPGRRARRAPLGSWLRALGRRLGGMPGVEIEDKGASLSIHYRAAPDPEAAAGAVARAITGIRGATVIPGKRVWNLLPAGAGDKGTALRQLVATTGAARLLFVGDDATDEDAFRAALPVPAITVRVGHHPETAARFHVRGRADVDRLLRHLALLRRGPPAPSSDGRRRRQR